MYMVFTKFLQCLKNANNGTFKEGNCWRNLVAGWFYSPPNPPKNQKYPLNAKQHDTPTPNFDML